MHSSSQEGKLKVLIQVVMGRHTYMVVEDGSFPRCLPSFQFKIVRWGRGIGGLRTEQKVESWPDRAMNVPYLCYDMAALRTYLPED